LVYRCKVTTAPRYSILMVVIKTKCPLTLNIQIQTYTEYNITGHDGDCFVWTTNNNVSRKLPNHVFEDKVWPPPQKSGGNTQVNMLTVLRLCHRQT
jgi:hypothetical protein